MTQITPKPSLHRSRFDFRVIALILCMPLLGACAVLDSFKSPGSSTSSQAESVERSGAEDSSVAEEAAGRFGIDPSEPMLPDVALRFHVLTAELAMQRGNPAAAAEHYLAAARLDNDVRLVESATRAALVAQRYDIALLAVERWSELDPESRQPRQLALRLHLAAGNAARVNELAEALIEDHPEGREAGLSEVAVILSSEQQHAEEALAVMKRLVAKAPTEPSARYALALMALRLEQFELAEQQADWALRLKPDWHEAAMLKGQAQLRQDNHDGAEETMKSALMSDPKDLDLILGFARLFLEAEAYAQAGKAYARALAVDAKNQESLYALGLLALEARQADNGYQYLKRLYDITRSSDDEQERSRNVEAAFYLGRIEEQRKNWRKAQEWYAKVDSGDNAYDAQTRTAFVIYKQGNLAEARQHLADMRRRFPAQALEAYLSEAEILYDARDYPAAMEQYDLALQQFPEEPDLLYGRALILTELKRVDQAVADLRGLLKDQPDDARSLNALGYILTNYTENYEEALGYIEKALELAPDDAAVIDSMGWVQYRMGNLNSALAYLQKAWERYPDPEIAAHLGEVLWKLGQQERAGEIWNQALREDPDHPVLKETVTRLKR